MSAAARDMSLKLLMHSLLASRGGNRLGVVLVEAGRDAVLLVGLTGTRGERVGVLERLGRDGLVLTDEALASLLVNVAQEAEELGRDALAL
jgi:hypothetical protein